jgi:hypothetical protein
MRPNLNEAKRQAKKDCSSFVDCEWDDDSKCLSFWFKNPLDAESFRVQRELRDKSESIRREVEGCKMGAFSSMREYYQ